MKITDILTEADFDFDDLKLKGLGSELDRDDTDKGFNAPAMVDQLGKILDSRGNPNPITSVKTDDGKEVKITMDQASTLMALLKREPRNYIDREEKNRFRDEIQTSPGLNPFLDAGDGKSMQQVFVQKYGKGLLS